MSRASDDLLRIVEQRGGQYGLPHDNKANLRASTRFNVDPIVGCLVRAGDKWARIEGILYGTNLTNYCDTESYRDLDYVALRDQMLDIAGYMIKAMELLDERYDLGEASLPDSKSPEPNPPGRRRSRSLLDWLLGN